MIKIIFTLFTISFLSYAQEAKPVTDISSIGVKPQDYSTKVPLFSSDIMDTASALSAIDNRVTPCKVAYAINSGMEEALEVEKLLSKKMRTLEKKIKKVKGKRIEKLMKKYDLLSRQIELRRQEITHFLQFDNSKIDRVVTFKWDLENLKFLKSERNNYDADLLKVDYFDGHSLVTLSEHFNIDAAKSYEVKGNMVEFNFKVKPLSYCAFQGKTISYSVKGDLYFTYKDKKMIYEDVTIKLNGLIL